jgi:hypothetical protein
VPGTNLTRDEAAARAALLHVDSYEVVLDLTTGPDDLRHDDDDPLRLRRAGRSAVHTSSTSSVTR